MKQVFAAAFAAAILHPTTAAVAADAQRGEQLYGNRCSGCHSVEMNRIGPKHQGVFGREAGTVADYDYSEALRESNVVWDEASLEAWLTKPQDFIPGQKMFFSLGKADERSDIIAYLKQVSE